MLESEKTEDKVRASLLESVCFPNNSECSNFSSAYPVCQNDHDQRDSFFKSDICGLIYYTAKLIIPFGCTCLFQNTPLLHAQKY